ncbi:MAG: hypothetical protein PHR27_10020 [Candidatus Cloacimonetes bacterium]|jgi:hypothetical protein|nr:hypothetical protein [Candidatus Cloacimonadota bacterium]
MDQSKDLYDKLRHLSFDYSRKKKAFSDHLKNCLAQIDYLRDGLPLQAELSNDLQVKLVFCDQTFLICFSMKADKNGTIAACGQAYKQETDFCSLEDTPKFRAVGEKVYVDQNHLYNFTEGVFTEFGDTLYGSYWFDNFIQSALSHTFD